MQGEIWGERGQSMWREKWGEEKGERFTGHRGEKPREIRAKKIHKKRKICTHAQMRKEGLRERVYK